MEKEKKLAFFKEVLGFVFVFIISYSIFMLGSKYVFFSNLVTGESMYPTLHDADRLLSNRLVNEGNIHYGDVVVIKGKTVEGEYWVKRIIGLPNDVVYAKDDVVYVNDMPVDESYLNTEYVAEIKKEFGVFTYDFDEVVLGENEFFVMGDNRMYSMDSRRVGPFQLEDIVSKDYFIYYPFNHIKIGN